MTHVLRQDWIDDTPSTGSSSGLIMFGLVLGILLLVPLLMMCGGSTPTSNTDLNTLLEAPTTVIDAPQTVVDDSTSTMQTQSITTTNGSATTGQAAAGSNSTTGTTTNQQNAAPTATPASESEGQAYWIADGDTLWGIATQFGVSVEALTAANGLSPDSFLQPGDQIKIPAN